jgi:hypothetical protein
MEVCPDKELPGHVMLGEDAPHGKHFPSSLRPLPLAGNHENPVRLVKTDSRLGDVGNPE